MCDHGLEEETTPKDIGRPSGMSDVTIAPATRYVQWLLRLQEPIARVSLGKWPTPVRPLERLAAELGIELWLKCDHEASAEYGGNKVRKLELLLGDAKAQGAMSVLTVGGLGSHQITATGLFADRIGAVPAAIVYPQPITPWVMRTVELWDRLRIKLTSIDSVSDLSNGIERAVNGLTPPIYMIPAGGSSPLGNIAFVEAAVEVASQVSRGEIPRPDEIVVACGTGGTIAGLVLGLAIAGFASVRVIGVRCGSRGVGTGRSIREQIAALRQLVERRGGCVPQVEMPEVELVDSGAEYGVPTKEALAAIALARTQCALELEPTYTGRALAAIVKRAEVRGRSRVMLWHTGTASLTTRFYGDP